MLQRAGVELSEMKLITFYRTNLGMLECDEGDRNIQKRHLYKRVGFGGLVE
jgi:hypothetical protein